MTYVMSDIHGCYAKVRAMLETISFAPDDTLYVLGDVLDRGPDGFKILLDMAQRPNAFNLMGNHEAMALDALACILGAVQKRQKHGENILSEEEAETIDLWFCNGGELSLADFLRLNEKEAQIVWDYMRNMPLYKEVEAGGKRFVLVHWGLGNFAPSRPLDDYAPEEILWCRPDLDAAYFPDKILIFGHTPTRLLYRQIGEQELPDRIFHRGTMIGVDCGCACAGRALGCLCLDTMEEFVV